MRHDLLGGRGRRHRGSCGMQLERQPSGQQRDVRPGTALDAGVCYVPACAPPAGRRRRHRRDGPRWRADAAIAADVRGRHVRRAGVELCAPSQWDPATGREVPQPRSSATTCMFATYCRRRELQRPHEDLAARATSLVLDGLTANGSYSVVVRAVNEANVEEKNTVEKTGKAQADSEGAHVTGAKAGGGSAGRIGDALVGRGRGRSHAPRRASDTSSTWRRPPRKRTSARPISSPARATKSFSVKGLSRPGFALFLRRSRDSTRQGTSRRTPTEVTAKAGRRHDRAGLRRVHCRGGTRSQLRLTSHGPQLGRYDAARGARLRRVCVEDGGGQDFASPNGTFTGVNIGVVTGHHAEHDVHTSFAVPVT